MRKPILIGSGQVFGAERDEAAAFYHQLEVDILAHPLGGSAG
ncbi:MAG: hypothetical protein R3D66_04990 [Alphaproteobacteria bacterium]